ncbi:MAG: hypothetical protein Fur0042_20990 [Cyanophyceae cyanobacterium]
MTDAFSPILERAVLDQIRTVLAARSLPLAAFDAALDEIEACEGDLEDAAIAIAIRCGQLPDREGWLEGLAKRSRGRICTTAPLREALGNGDWGTVFALLDDRPLACPEPLVLPVLLWVAQLGIGTYCAPLDQARPTDPSLEA